MKFTLAILGLFATSALCTAVDGISDMQPREEDHPALRGIPSSLYNPDESPENLESNFGTSPVPENPLDKRSGNCGTQGGRGSGPDYDYGCATGWCWRNCDGPFEILGSRKKWCWLKYESGNGGWTPCGRWQDCEWSYNNKNAKCARGSCKSCGCGC